MNIVRELRIKKGIQQKELALELGISSAAVSNWEHGKSDPTGERLKKLAEFFEVDPLVVLGSGVNKPQQKLFVPEDPKISGKSETEQIIERLLQQLDAQPKTPESKILVRGIDKLPQAQREQAVNVVRAMFSKYADYFDDKEQTDES